ncbi:hypothetical protein I4U23_021327 [Adineta vaga]|nr:hypothetical protein I4U23_021327 [Adineta vaga]
MPDLPPVPSARPSGSIPIMTRESHPLTARSFSKINLSGGPFNVKFYHNTNFNDNYTSVEIEAEQSIHKFISIDIIQNDILTIRLTENLNINNQTNITLVIIYQQLTELYIDGMTNIQCINQIQTNIFRIHNRGTGSIKLKLNVNILDAYLHSIGRVKICGQVNEEAILKSLGVGDVDCRHLLTKKMNVVSSGIGNIYVTATDEVQITLSGIGTVYYAGPLKQQIKTGLGNIVEIPNISSTYDDQQILNEELH